MNKRTVLTRVVPLVAALAVGGGIGAAVYAGFSGGSSSSSSSAPAVASPTTTIQPAVAKSTTSSLNEIYTSATPGVVDITVTQSSSGGFGFGQQQSQAEGTGFVYDSKGDIITAAHVVDGANSVKVKFKDGKTYSGTVVGSDNSTDTAVVKVNAPASELHPLTIGDSSVVKPGDEVVAIGSPFGLTETMTAGIVSAVGRTITAPNNYSISGAIQTDAPINHGNSGGPLLNSGGAVIGVNVQIDSQSNGSEGVGFSTPINTVKNVANTFIAGGKVQHAYLGIQVGDAANDGGAQVSCVVSGSPADNAGMKAGDVITEVGSTPITSSDGLTAAVNSYKPGDKVTMKVTRSGSSKDLSVTFGNRPSSATTCS